MFAQGLHSKQKSLHRTSRCPSADGRAEKFAQSEQYLSSPLQNAAVHQTPQMTPWTEQMLKAEAASSFTGRAVSAVLPDVAEAELPDAGRWRRLSPTQTAAVEE
jgi:hypothetical protein